jgi:NTP pyrophosphatase (non-canonical NTP hydrolase)
VNELGSGLARISIQGMNTIDPASSKPNRQQLEEEMADVLAQIRCNMTDLGLNLESIMKRAEEKVAMMAQWEAHFA